MIAQLDMVFDGRTYDHDRDGSRLNAQFLRVFNLMRDGQWRTLEMISAATGDPPASVSARLRDMRKTKFGSHSVNRKYVSDGLWTYQLEPAGSA